MLINDEVCNLRGYGYEQSAKLRNITNLISDASVFALVGYKMGNIRYSGQDVRL